MTAADPEVGRSVRSGELLTNRHDVGTGAPLLMLHGSGPGVSAWSNGRSTRQHLSPYLRMLAPDLAGFGYTRVPRASCTAVGSGSVGVPFDLTDGLDQVWVTSLRSGRWGN